jgi:hypothetical protein
MWSLGKVIQTPEVIRVYIGSFWDHTKDVDHKELLGNEQKDLLNDLHALPKNAAVRKVNEIIKRARLARVHAQILNHLRAQMPAMFGKSAKQDKLIKNLASEFTAVQRQFHLPVGDFPEFQRFQERLRKYDFDAIPRMSSKAMQSLELALSKDLPALIHSFPQAPLLGLHRVVNPFTGEVTPACNAELSYGKIDHEAHRKIFLALHPRDNEVIKGAEAKILFSESGLPEDDLGRIWKLADFDSDGALNFDEFSIALHLIKYRKNGGELPAVLPDALKP